MFCRQISFSVDKMSCKSPSVPQQSNSCDCGVFLLHYVELIFGNPSFFRFPSKVSKQDFQDWFQEEEVRHKRKQIADLIQVSEGEIGTSEKLICGCIFLDPGARRR